MFFSQAMKPGREQHLSVCEEVSKGMFSTDRVGYVRIASTSLSNTIKRRTHCAHYPQINTNALSHFRLHLKLVALKQLGLFKDHVFFFFFSKQPINQSQVVTLNDCQLSPLQDRTSETERKRMRRREIREEC